MFGKYESNDESFVMVALIIRHVEAIAALAERDLVLLPSATTLARAAFETAVRVLWMLDPDDVFEREARWLGFLRQQEKDYTRLAERIANAGGDPSGLVSRRDTIHEFRTGVEALLPHPHKMIYPAPKMDKMLASIGCENWYVHYTLSSQYVHGTLIATELYRKDLGTAKKMGEHIEPNDWYNCLVLCWWSLSNAGIRNLERSGGDKRAFVTEELLNEVALAIDEVRTH